MKVRHRTCGRAQARVVDESLCRATLKPERPMPLPDEPWLPPLLAIASSLSSEEAAVLAARQPSDSRFLELAIQESGLDFDRAWFSVYVAVASASETATGNAVTPYDPRDPQAMPGEFVVSARTFCGVALAQFAPSRLSQKTLEVLLSPLDEEMRDALGIDGSPGTCLPI